MAPALANLFEASHDFAEAAEYFLLAAQNATRVFANHEAIALARRGLQATASLPDTFPRAQQEIALQLALGWPLINVVGYAAAEVEQTYTRARELCERQGETARMYAGALGPRDVPPESSRVWEGAGAGRSTSCASHKRRTIRRRGSRRITCSARCWCISVTRRLPASITRMG